MAEQSLLMVSITTTEGTVFSRVPQGNQWEIWLFVKNKTKIPPLWHVYIIKANKG